ncbi:MAG TPA: hypothetical protein VGU20_31215 [Stellaceae bacterium]|nr:hypothetical protein [Terriglobia bacterium]HEV2551822.1 hypothetical protein [Stellaceae bacterium]
MITYKVTRLYFRDDSRRFQRTIKTRLACAAAGFGIGAVRLRTEQRGPWFDSYDQE